MNAPNCWALSRHYLGLIWASQGSLMAENEESGGGAGCVGQVGALKKQEVRSWVSVPRPSPSLAPHGAHL